MAIVEIRDKSRIAHLFDGWDETMIWSCLQDCMGEAYAEDTENPRAAQILLGDFCVFAGEPTEALVRNVLSDSVILVPQNRGWELVIERCYGSQAKRWTRYATKKDASAFDVTALRGYVAELPPQYELRAIDAEIYDAICALDWAVDLCINFDSREHYLTRGLGVVALCDGEIAAGASSYSFYDGGIEIEIDTRRDFRRRGLATACGAALILECLARGLYPSWDAHTEASLALAEKLGYEFSHSYVSYELEF